MPTYQYECKACGHELEAFQNISEAPLERCPQCNKKKLGRVVTGGLGFFVSGRTVGAIADKNTDKFSEDFKSHLKERNKTKKENKLKLPEGASPSPAPTTVEKPWYKKEQKVSDRKLAQASPEQLKNYVEKGKLEK